MGAVACMMASQGLDSFSQSGLYSNHQVRQGTKSMTFTFSQRTKDAHCQCIHVKEDMLILQFVPL